MKVIYEKDIEVNNEIKGNLGKQQDEIKHLKKQYDINNEDKVQEIAAAKSPTKKNKADCDMSGSVTIKNSSCFYY